MFNKNTDINPTYSGKKPLVFTIAFGGYEHRFASCIASQRTYAARYGYEYEVVSKSTFSPRGHEAAWLKLLLLRQALTGNRPVAFIDADCRISKKAPEFESCFDENTSMCMAMGFSGRVNSGVMFAKPDAINRLDTMIQMMMQEVPEEDRAPYENGHVIHYTKGWSGLTVLSKAWNNTLDEEMDDYIRHFCGGKGLRRVYKSTRYEQVSWTLYKSIDVIKRLLGFKQFGSGETNQVVHELFNDVIDKYPVFTGNQLMRGSSHQ